MLTDDSRYYYIEGASNMENAEKNLYDDVTRISKQKEENEIIEYLEVSIIKYIINDND